MQPTEQFRLFVAFTVPAEVKRGMEMAQAELRGALPDRVARWTKSEQLHLTLRFLGNVAAARVEELVAAARSACQPFVPLRLTAAGIGFFPTARFPRVVWVGVKDSADLLARLWKVFQSATQPFTQEPPGRDFAGHVTLARLDRLRRDQVEALARAACKFEATVFGEWTAAQLELMRSELSPQGARHSLLATLPLAGT